jgi:ferric-dicitrate binding protein FerR (iron transport regulator)
MPDDMRNLERMGERVAVELGDGPSEVRREAQKRALLSLVAASRPAGEGRILPNLMIAAAVLLAFALGAMLLYGWETPLKFWVGEQETVGSEGSWVKASADAAVPIRFDNGSRLKLDARTAVRVVASNMEIVKVDLSKGLLHADVKRNGKTSWIISAGPYQVTVLGTTFSVDWDSDSSILGVSVNKGKVLVRGGHLSEHGIRVQAGKRLVANGDKGSVAMESILEDSDTADDGELASAANTGSIGESRPGRTDEGVEVRETDQLIPPAAKGGASVAAKNPANTGTPKGNSPSWKDLSDAREFSAAVAAAKQQGLDELLATLDASDLWALANAARYAHDATVSARALLAVRERFAGSQRAFTAAFMLGRLKLDMEGNPTAATAWFETYLKEKPSGPLAEEALGRLIDACDKAGRKTEAVRNAEIYLSRYNGGLFTKLAKSILRK